MMAQQQAWTPPGGRWHPLTDLHISRNPDRWTWRRSAPSTRPRRTAGGPDGLRTLPTGDMPQHGKPKQADRTRSLAEADVRAKFVTEDPPDCRVHPRTSKGYANVLFRQ